LFIPAIILLFAGYLAVDARAQSLTVFDVDAQSYPTMRAKFHAFDSQGIILYGLTPGDFLLYENGEERLVVDIQCPTPGDPRQLSAVLTMDVSGSMDEGRLALARAAAYAWIDAFPPGNSECAVTSFTTSNALQQDFTNDRELLRAAVDRLRAGGGTSFDAALIDPFAGAFPIVQRGKFHKVVVLLTDGKAFGSEAAILATARQAGAQVFCVTIGEDTPDLLRHLCDETGGRYFSRVMSREDILRIYRSILQSATEDAPCVLTWESGGCAYAREVDVMLPAHGSSARTRYSVTRSDLPVITFHPSVVITFDGVAPGTQLEKAITLEAEGRSVEIRAIRPDDARFTITDYGGTAPPFTIPSGQSRVLLVRYAALDSSYASCSFLLETSACEAAFFATAGYPGKGEDERVITLLHPNGGEVFVAGSDTLITWTDVSLQDEVRLDFSANAGADWSQITARASGLSHPWRVPNIVSDQCLVRVTLLQPGPAPDDMILLPPGSFIMGDLSGTGSSVERPSHEVSLTTPLYMSTHEITQRAWIDVMGFNPSSQSGDQLPVTDVSWLEAVEYCNRRSEAEGLPVCYIMNGDSVQCDFSAAGYRLPTEAEWEYACRAGSNDDFANGGMRDPYCDGPDPNLSRLGWYCGNANAALHPVASLAPNAFGLYDMHGNAPEWCWDFLNVYDAAQQVDPRGPFNAAPVLYRVYRGGGWSRFASECRNSARNGTHQQTQSGIGFRVVRRFR
jgi:formylglycine-generating enzyme required for sulfatase activity